MNTVNLTVIANCLEARANCLKSGNTEWANKHLEHIVKELEGLPRGSGLDAGVDFDVTENTLQSGNRVRRIIFRTEFHHMDAHGSYDGWTQHTIILTPKFGGYDMRITGKNRNDIKTYLYELFSDVFTTETVPSINKQ